MPSIKGLIPSPTGILKVGVIVVIVLAIVNNVQFLTDLTRKR